MTVFSSGAAPSWGELDDFEIIRVTNGEHRDWTATAEREKLIVAAGRGVARVEGVGRSFEKGDQIDLDVGMRARLETAGEEATIVRLTGHWGDEVGGCGLFTLSSSDNPQQRGDPTVGPRNADFDSHFHDCDEYWVIIGGSGVVETEGVRYPVTPGDGVATGRGHHHDFPIVNEPILAAYFETSLEGARRRGHLWEQKDGPAEPVWERV